jgi:hypothetical protein
MSARPGDRRWLIVRAPTPARGSRRATCPATWSAVVVPLAWTEVCPSPAAEKPVTLDLCHARRVDARYVRVLGGTTRTRHQHRDARRLRAQTRGHERRARMPGRGPGPSITRPARVATRTHVEVPTQQGRRAARRSSGASSRGPASVAVGRSRSRPCHEMSQTLSGCRGHRLNAGAPRVKKLVRTRRTTPFELRRKDAAHGDRRDRPSLPGLGPRP